MEAWTVLVMNLDPCPYFSGQPVLHILVIDLDPYPYFSEAMSFVLVTNGTTEG